MEKTKVAIVGSRRRSDRHSVETLVDCLPQDSIIVSGGCRGVDTWAVARARQRGLAVREFYPVRGLIKHKGDIVKRYHDRNKKIARYCDVVYAFVAPDRKGGTENTIMWAGKCGKQVIIM